MAGVTNALYKALDTAKNQDSAYLNVFQDVVNKHKDTAKSLLPPEFAVRFNEVIDKDSQALSSVSRFLIVLAGLVTMRCVSTRFSTLRGTGVCTPWSTATCSWASESCGLRSC